MPDGDAKGRRYEGKPPVPFFALVSMWAGMIGQEDGMFTIRFRKPKREQSPTLNDTQRALVDKKFEILRQASFGFTQDRLVHIQGEDLKGWTDACTDELRRKIVSIAPAHVKIALIDFRKLGCVSLQCLPLPVPSSGVSP